MVFSNQCSKVLCIYSSLSLGPFPAAFAPAFTNPLTNLTIGGAKDLNRLLLDIRKNIKIAYTTVTAINAMQRIEATYVGLLWNHFFNFPFFGLDFCEESYSKSSASIIRNILTCESKSSVEIYRRTPIWNRLRSWYRLRLHSLFLGIFWDQILSLKKHSQNFAFVLSRMPKELLRRTFFSWTLVLHWYLFADSMNQSSCH